MTIKVTQNGASVSKPGTYPAVKVQNLTGFPLQPTGIVAICGEAVGGEPGVLDVLEGPAIQAAKNRYKSGPIADALGLLVSPSKDPRIQNGASRIIVYKVNPGTQSTKLLKTTDASPLDIFKLTSKNWGVDENNVGVRILAGSILDANAAITGTIDGDFTLVGGETLIIKSLGATYTYTGSLTGVTTATALVADMNNTANWAGALKPVVASLSGAKVKITLDSTVVVGGDLTRGFLFVEPASTIDTIIGVTGSARGTKGSRFVGFKKGSLSEDAIPEIGGTSVLKVKYVGAGTACDLTIQDSLGNRTLTTVCAGAGADDLSLVLGVTEDGEMVSKMTISDVAEIINNHASYEATVTYLNPSLSALEMDFLAGQNIELVDFHIGRDGADFAAKVTSGSSLVSAERLAVPGQVALIATYEFLTGAIDGVATNGSWSAAFEALKGIRTELVIPLISADKGSATIDAINALADAHAVWSWGVEGKSPRQCFVSKLGTKAELKAAATALNSGYTSIFGQDVKVFSHSQQALKFLDPWAQACIAGGLKAGATVGEPITFKFVNINDLRVRDGSWNPRNDVTEMIDAGVTFFESVDSGGFRVVVGNTTYGTDGSFVWNRDSVVEAAGFVYYDLMTNLELTFTGTKARTGSAEAIANMVKARMEVYLTNDITVGDDNNEGLGFKDLRVRIGGTGVGGNTAVLDITVTPVQGIDFILPTIYLADIRQSA